MQAPSLRQQFIQTTPNSNLAGIPSDRRGYDREILQDPSGEIDRMNDLPSTLAP
jgi:hypothetical protein